tara:strand:+ start:10571 stop:10996 length:426 start_codon:yes stop_codon:yes gene_type:complete
MIPEDTIDYNIRKTWYNISKMYNKTANEYMASMSLGMLILNIDIYDGTPSTQIGPLMGMESTSLSRSLSNLEDRGVITRERDLSDKRKSIIKLTEYGIESREIAKKAVLDFNNKVLEHFTEDEIDEFFKILKKINEITNSL